MPAPELFLIAFPRPASSPFAPCRCSAPSAFHSLAAHLSTSLFLLGDATQALTDAAGAAGAAADAAPVADNGGFFGAFASGFESFLKVLDEGLEKAGVPYRWVGGG